MSEWLREAEEADNYLSLCNKYYCNALARKYSSYTLWYDQSLVRSAERFIPDDIDAKVIILNTSADGGMPHTRPYNLICLPAYFPEERLETTIQHELVHLDQRRNPLKWHNLLKRDGWKIENQNEIIRKIPNDILNRCRLNPDTLDIRFVSWQERYIPFPLFVREDKPELRDIQIRWFDLQEKTLRPFAPTSFLEKYGNNRSVSEMEHPYEYYAYAYENR